MSSVTRNPHGISAEDDLDGNKTYVGRSWTKDAFVWITRNESVNGTTEEKTSILHVTMRIKGDKKFRCRIVTRQPFPS